MPVNNEQDYEYEQERELNLLDLFHIAWRKKWLTLFLTVAFGAGAALYAWHLPSKYTATCRMLYSGGGGGGRMSGIAAQLGGVADFFGLSGTPSNVQMMIELMKSNSVTDAIINKFDLMPKVEPDPESGLTSHDVRVGLRASVAGSIRAAAIIGSGIMNISYTALDPQLAADVANQLVSELRNKLNELSISDAQQRKAFFEIQLAQAQEELSKAEDDIIKYQQSIGVISFESQTQSMLSSLSDLRKKIADKNVEISSLKSYARADNPKLRLAQSQLDGLNRELRRLEEEQKMTETSQSGRIIIGDRLSSIGQLPEMGVEYKNYERALKFATTKYETMLRQYENAKLNEVNDLSSLSILDPAEVPRRESEPRRLRITAIGTMLGFSLGVFWAFASYYFRKLKAESRYSTSDDDDEY